MGGSTGLNENYSNQGCGCDQPAPSGCDNECGSSLDFDDCGICGGLNSSMDEFGICDGDGTIQNAIDSANAGDTINVPVGTYNESISIDKTLNLVCANPRACFIDARGIDGRAVAVLAQGVVLDGFTIPGDASMYAGVVLTPSSSGSSVLNNTIFGMSLSNPSNSSPLSYGVLAYGQDQSTMPVGLTIANNEIYGVSGSAISLGDYTYGTTISGNTLRDILPVPLLGQDFSAGIQAQFSGALTIDGNNFSNLIIAASLPLSEAVMSNNSYSIFIGSYLTTTVPNNIVFDDAVDYWASQLTIADLGITFLESYASSLELAILTADSGTTVIGSDGSESIEDCLGIWGGEALIDDCGVCAGGNADVDACGNCFGGIADTDGDGTCDTEDDEPDCATNDTDDCGVCAGGNADVDARGDCFGGVADTDGDGTCDTEDDEPNCATDDTDDCGVCAGGNADVDACGDCFGGVADTDGDGTCDTEDDEPDCATNDTDDCGVCAGGNADKDCNGDCFGDAVLDSCGECSGGNSGHVADSSDLGCGCFEDAALTYYLDSDGDGQGAGNGVDYCLFDVTDGYVLDGGDADDNCSTNEYISWYKDGDEDGLGLDFIDNLCSNLAGPQGAVSNNDDLDDSIYCLSNSFNTYWNDDDGDSLGNGIGQVLCDESIEVGGGWVLNNVDVFDDYYCISNNFNVYYLDSDGDGLGSGIVENSNFDNLYCADNAQSNWVLNENDLEPDCATNDTDDCGVCAGGDADKDCNGDCFGDAVLDSCDVCSGGNTGHVADSDIDACGDCFGGVADTDGDGTCDTEDAEPNCATNDTDDCGICSGGNADVDACGNCFGGVADTDGDGACDTEDEEPNCATNDTDDCGICAGGNADKDCNGDCFGDAVADSCGECSVW